MSEKILTVSDSLWLSIDVVHPDYDDGLFSIRDNTGHDVYIDKKEIPELIVALQKVLVDQDGIITKEDTSRWAG